MTDLEELRQDMTNRINRVEERAQQGYGRIRDELADAKSQAKSDQAELIINKDHCLAESLALATKASEWRDSRMTREIERLLNDHDNIYAQTMPNLKERLDAKADLMMRKLDELLSISKHENCSCPREKSLKAADRFRAPRHAKIEKKLPTVPHVRLVPHLTTVSHDTTICASLFEP